MSEQELWQQRIDRDFPHGFLMTWEGREDSVVYRMAVARVQGMAGAFGPQVHVETLAEPGRAFDLVLVSYDQTQDEPLVVRVTAENVNEPMLWSANVSPELAALMDAVREERYGEG